MEIIKAHIDKDGNPLKNRAERRFKFRSRVRERSYKTSHKLASIKKLFGGQMNIV